MVSGQLLTEMEVTIQQQQQRDNFRSCFSIQSTFFSPSDRIMNKKQFEIELKLEALFEKLSDKTENLLLITPISCIKSQLKILRKQISVKMGQDVIEKPESDTLKLESFKTLTIYHEFTIDLLNNRSYIELLITENYLEKWREKYMPQLKEDKERLKERLFEIERQTKINERKLEQKNSKHIEDIFEQLKEEKLNLKTQLTEIDNKLNNIDLTIGLFCDELYSLFDHICSEQQQLVIDQYKNIFEQIAGKLAQLMYRGFGIHILRGRPLFSHSRLIEMTLKQLDVNGPLTILSVVGEQSSAKSSLLNTTFGCNFRVSAGRCTIGMYLGKYFFWYPLISKS
ncbi:unnamed protein product [Didymodactylos carnosus]|uniref:VLIG-type G domain-containing protein n=1 Tax=Didymodactylos carnosus TaxID=1234261 RepID=A0A815JT40_9BILA|nr:unnamed protein product [Didymodactylos carnosus]CAF4281429.1 unnamed protein product [Didymodactylos carnosus]